VAIGEVLEKSLLLLRGPLKEVAPRLDVAPELKVSGDSQRLQQVFINLVQNAVDAGAGKIEIGARSAENGSWRPAAGVWVAGAPPAPGARGVVVWVADDGPGIPPESLARVFDPFFTTREPGHGVGLGLYIVAEIVEEHRGCVAAESPAAGGARFALWLPAAEGAP